MRLPSSLTVVLQTIQNLSLSGFNGRGVAMATVLGRVLSEHISGVPKEELDFPVKKIRPLSFPGLQKKLIPLAIWYKKLADRWDL